MNYLAIDRARLELVNNVVFKQFNHSLKCHLTPIILMLKGGILTKRVCITEGCRMCTAHQLTVWKGVCTYGSTYGEKVSATYGPTTEGKGTE